MRDRPALRHVRTVARLASALGLAALVGCAPERAPVRTVALSDCRLPRLATALRCAEIEVPEDRTRPEGRRIKLFAAILPANTLDARADPLLLLAGGPGQAASALAPFAARLVEVRRHRDVVLIDQRGTGRSSPLRCEAFDSDTDTLDALDVDPVPRARRCVKELGALGIDLGQYTTEATIADLEAARAALGYPRWNLWGGSYGSRVALEYVRAHPERVRSMVLDGVAPPSLRVPLGVWSTREGALDAIFAACARSPSCAAAHPDPAALLASMREALGEEGKRFDVIDPRTGVPQMQRINADALVAALHPLTYLPELGALVPELLALGGAGDFAPLFAVTQMVTQDLAKQMSVPLHYAVTCAEDVPRIGSEERAALTGLRSGRLAERVLEVCEVWPRSITPATTPAPVTSDVPALLLSGGLDPVTPPAYAEEVAKTLVRHRQVIAPGYGHIVSPHACGPSLIAAFVDRADFEALPRRCVEHFERSVRPPLWPDRLAPAP